MALSYDLGGNDLIVNSITTGATGPGSTASGTVTFSSNPAFSVGNTIKSNVAATTFTSNAATGTSYFVQGTTPSLVTAGGASQTEVYTLTGVAATDIALVTLAGGTNTTKNITLSAVCTTNTVTVTIYNNTASTALNGTVIFNLVIFKA